MTLAPFFFDVLHLDGDDLLDRPLAERAAILAELVGEWRVPAIETDDPDAADAFLADALATGHEGVMVKALDSRYDAGRRGAAWRKVKPVRTLDLVVLAAEWGHGRRRGWLSNLHLGARDPETGEFVMVGKTFKGLTDELLTWQTEQLQEIATRTRRLHACTCVRSSSSRSRSTACRCRRATRAASRCGSRACAPTGPTRRPPTPTRSTPSARCSHRERLGVRGGPG